MTLPRGNPRIPEGINARDEHPVKEFLLLAAGVSAAVAAAVFALSLALHLLAPYIPFTWEAGAMPSALQGLAENDEPGTADVQAAVAALGKALVASSLEVPIDGEPAAGRVPPGYFHFALVRMDTPNAFATLGANIAVTDALLGKLETENGLAMVLAHEIAHVQLRHPIEAASRGVVLQVVLAAVFGRDTGSLWSGSLSAGGVFTMLSFNRSMELAADRRALQILRAHYGHLAGADEFFRRMQAEDDRSAWLEFANTHPATARRIQLIREAMAADGPGAKTTPLTLP